MDWGTIWYAECNGGNLSPLRSTKVAWCFGEGAPKTSCLLFWTPRSSACCDCHTCGQMAGARKVWFFPWLLLWCTNEAPIPYHTVPYGSIATLSQLPYLLHSFLSSSPLCLYYLLLHACLINMSQLYYTSNSLYPPCSSFLSSACTMTIQLLHVLQLQPLFIFVSCLCVHARNGPLLRVLSLRGCLSCNGSRPLGRPSWLTVASYHDGQLQRTQSLCG